MGRLHLPFSVLQKTGFVALGDSWPAHVLRQPSSVLAGVQSQTTGLRTDQLDLRVIEKTRKDARGIRTTTHTGVHALREFSSSPQDLGTRFLADNGLKVRDHLRKGVWSTDCAHHVVRRVHR